MTNFLGIIIKLATKTIDNKTEVSYKAPPLGPIV